MDELASQLNLLLHNRELTITVDRLELDTYQIGILTGWFHLVTYKGLYFIRGKSVYLDAEYQNRNAPNFAACALVGERLIEVRAKGHSLTFETEAGAHILFEFDGDGESGLCSIDGDKNSPRLL